MSKSVEADGILEGIMARLPDITPHHGFMYLWILGGLVVLGALALGYLAAHS